MKNEAGIANKYLVLDAERKGKPRRGQGGVKERLFCAKCESILNEQYEKYAYHLLYVRGFEYSEIINEYSGRVVNIDYQKFKLFLLSILFRVSISKHRFCAPISIGMDYEDEIRNMLLHNNAKSRDYYPIMISLIHREGSIITDWVLQPIVGKFDKHTCYQFILGSHQYIIILSDYKIDDYLDQFVLGEDGSVIVISQDLRDIKNIMQLIDKVKQNSSL